VTALKTLILPQIGGARAPQAAAAAEEPAAAQGAAPGASEQTPVSSVSSARPSGELRNVG